MDVDALIIEAEAAIRSGDLHRAADAVERAAGARPDDSSLWLRLAALYRGGGRPGEALTAVHRALAAAPLDFAALLMRASLLDKLGAPEAPEAWGHALANKPPGELP